MQNIWSEENPHAIQKVLLHSVQQIIHFGTLKCVEKLVYMLWGMLEGRRGVLAVLINYGRFALPFYSNQVLCIQSAPNALKTTVLSSLQSSSKLLPCNCKQHVCVSTECCVLMYVECPLSCIKLQTCSLVTLVCANRWAMYVTSISSTKQKEGRVRIQRLLKTSCW